MSEPGFGPEASFRRVAAITAILSVVPAFACAITGLAAERFDFAAMADPGALLRAGHAAAGLWRVSLLLDMFGYYLMLVPLALALRVALAGVGWCGFGWLLLARARWIAILTLVLGAAELANSAGMISGQEWLFMSGLSVYLTLATIWPLIMGIRLLGSRPLFADG